VDRFGLRCCGTGACAGFVEQLVSGRAAIAGSANCLLGAPNGRDEISLRIGGFRRGFDGLRLKRRF
jgi:hypothetical protein